MLLKGLEISEIRLKDLEETFRIDSEYFLRSHLAVEARLREMDAQPISEVAAISDGNHLGVSEEFDTVGVPYYRGGDVHGFFIENSNPACFVDKTVYDEPAMQRSHLQRNDILITIVGAVVGNVSIVSSDTPSMCSCKIAILRPKHVEDMAALALFLQGRYGNSQIYRLVRGSVKPGFNLDDFDKFYMPSFGKGFKAELTDAVNLAKQNDFMSQKIMADAEAQLLRELGFADWQPPTKTVSVRNCSDFMAAGRFDAEYFLPKYDELLKKLEAVPVRHLGGADGLAEFYKSEDPGSDCYGDEGVPFVRIADFSEFGIESVGVHVPSEVCADYRRPRKDTILLSKDGSVGIAYKVEEDLDVVTSGGILHLAVTDPAVLPDYLTLVLNSKIVRMQAERDAGGSIIQHWKPSEIARVAIPILPMAQQREIVRKVQSSFAARKESKRLLEQAKRAVEVAIESGEAAGLAVLKGKGIAEKE